MQSSHEQFRELAWKCGLVATHQRQVIYESVVAMPGHYSPENIYSEVRRRTPSISLATVYKHLRLFVEHGLLREVSPHASTLLAEGNLEPHHHLAQALALEQVAIALAALTVLTRQRWLLLISGVSALTGVVFWILAWL